MDSQPPKNKPTAMRGLLGTVVEVDQESALIELDKHPWQVELNRINVLRKATGFGSLVEAVDDFLAVTDQVYVDIKQRKNANKKRKEWYVSHIDVCTVARRSCYGNVRDYIRRVKHPGHWPPATSCHVPPRCVGEVVSVMSEALQAWPRIPADLFLDIVDDCFDDLDGVFERYIPTEKALLSFVRSVPHYFVIDEHNRICAHQGFDQEQFESEISKLSLNIDVPDKLHALNDANDVRVIRRVRDAFSVLNPLLTRARERHDAGHEPGLVVALDCEGVNLGKAGRLTLVQIATMEGQVYLFDVNQCPPLFDDGLLAEFLESEAVLKVIHDCRSDAAALYHQFGITLTNIFDTSIAYQVLQDQCQVEEGRPRRRIGMKKLCELIGLEADHKNDKFKKKMIHTPNFWARRPLKSDMIMYAAYDVYLLVPDVYTILDSLIHPNWKSIFSLKCEDTIKEQIGEEEEEEEEEDEEEDETSFEEEYLYYID